MNRTTWPVLYSFRKMRYIAVSALLIGFTTHSLPAQETQESNAVPEVSRPSEEGLLPRFKIVAPPLAKAGEEVGIKITALLPDGSTNEGLNLKLQLTTASRRKTTEDLLSMNNGKAVAAISFESPGDVILMIKPEKEDKGQNKSPYVTSCLRVIP